MNSIIKFSDGTILMPDDSNKHKTMLFKINDRYLTGKYDHDGLGLRIEFFGYNESTFVYVMDFEEIEFFKIEDK